MRRDLTWLLSQPIFWAISGTLAGPYLFVRGTTAFFLRRLTNIQRSSVRAAAMGLVRISGTATGPYTLPAPLSGEECLYYRLLVVEDSSDKFAGNPKEACALLFLDD